eukprot:s59_g38.t1
MEGKLEAPSQADGDSTIKYELQSQADGADATMSTTDPLWADAVVPDVQDEGLDKLVESIMEALVRILNKYGSCGAFLQARFGEKDAAHEFATFLHDLCAPDHPNHCLKHPLPTCTLDEQALAKSQRIRLPLAVFSFHQMSSLKPDADHAFVVKLANLILKHGFISATEPLLITSPAELYQMAQSLGVPKPWDEPGTLLPFSLGFVKGKARMHTLLTLLAVCHDNNVPLKTVTCWAMLFG